MKRTMTIAGIEKTITKTVKKKVEFVVHESGSCRKVFIPRKYCTIVLKGSALDHIETSVNGKDREFENLSSDLPCQKSENIK